MYPLERIKGVKLSVSGLEKVYQGRLSTALRNDMSCRRGLVKRLLKDLAAERVFWGLRGG